MKNLPFKSVVVVFLFSRITIHGTTLKIIQVELNSTVSVPLNNTVCSSVSFKPTFADFDLVINMLGPSLVSSLSSRLCLLCVCVVFSLKKVRFIVKTI